MALLDPSSDFSLTEVTFTAGPSDLETLKTFDNILYNEAQVSPLEPFRYGSYYFHMLDYTNNQYQIATFANTTSQDSNVAYAQFMYEAVLRKAVNSSSFQYTMVNDPMPIVQILRDREKGENGVFLGFVLAIAFSLIPTSIIGYLMDEKVNSLVHQQVISGMNRASYWISNFVFDIIKTYVTVIIAIISIYALDLDLDYAWLLLLLFPAALVSYTYASSFLFREEATAQTVTMIHNFFIAGLMPIGIFILRIIKSTRDVGDFFMWPFRIIPTFNLCGGIVFISTKKSIATLRKEDESDALDGDVALPDVIFLIIHPFIWIALIILLQNDCFRCYRMKGKQIENEKEEIDNDVIEQQQIVEETSEQKLAVKADHLCKIYGNKVAVKNISFSLKFGDCFALLGVNGAGKTSTFKMLTGDVNPSRGECYVVGFDCIKQFEMARKQIGYCPQFDAIFNKLTVREHLEFYTKIKKIPKNLREDLIVKQLKAMNLEQYERKYAGTLSGGNKRKLSVAIAMIGNPPVVFLDEPSAGMDPKARRFMWEVIAKMSTRGKDSAVILTTHSMEEAEALSTNMGIMVDGQFKCFGSKQHIKNKFGKGYQVEIKFKSMTNKECEAKAEQLRIK